MDDNDKDSGADSSGKRRDIDVEFVDGPTSAGLSWHADVVANAPKSRRSGKTSWLASSAASIHALYQLNDADAGGDSDTDDETDDNDQTLDARRCLEVASLFFNLFSVHGVGLRGARRWLQKCHEALDGHAGDSNDQMEVRNGAKRLETTVASASVTITGDTSEKTLASGEVGDLIDGLQNSQSEDDWKEKAWSVLALSAIAELLAALSVVSRSAVLNDEMSAILYSQQLGELFTLVGSKRLGKWYDRSSKNLSLSVGVPKGKSGDDDNDLVDLAEEAIANSKSVEEVVSVLTAKGKVTLNTYQKSYLEVRFIRHNLEQLPTEVDELLTQSPWETTKNIADLLEKITLLGDIPAPINGLKACKALLACHDQINRNEELICLSKVKITCLEHRLSSYPKRDIDFMDAMGTLLRTCDDVDAVDNQLGLRAFHEERSNACGKLVARILEHRAQTQHTAMSSLRRVAEDLKDHDAQWAIEDQLKELVWSYVRPVRIRKALLDGRQVIEVICKKTTLSKVLPEVLSMFEMPRVEEVRFVATDCLRLDANLDAGKWHGVNVWIQTSLLQVVGQVVLDVSGSDGMPVKFNRKASDGVEPGQRGKKGSDGTAGESGGNVSIYAEEMDHPEALIVVSSGGAGGGGQDGGNGRKGTDGFGYTKDGLEIFLNQQSFYYWSHNELVASITACSVKRRVFSTEKNFYNVLTDKGGEIIYSYDGPWSWGNAFYNNLFFLYKGGPGMVGGRGGTPGKGGMGGYAGTVEFNGKIGHRIQKSEPGRPGSDGAKGQDAENGKSGTDIGFVANPSEKAKWYEGGLLDVQYTSDKPYGQWIWCSYYDMYALLVPSQRSPTYVLSETEKVTEDTKLETQAVANKKQNISTESMLNTYQQYTNAVQVTSNVRGNFEAALKREMAELRSLSAVAVKEKVKINVHREKYIAERVEIIAGGVDVGGNIVEQAEPLDATTVEKLVTEMASNPNIKEKWLALKHFVPSQNQFKRLFDASAVSNQAEIRDFLLEKYRATSLQQVAKAEGKHFESFSLERGGEQTEKYLTQDEDRVLVVDPNEQKRVRQHFAVLQQGKKSDAVSKTLNRVVKCFADDIHEVGNEVMSQHLAKSLELEAAKESAWQQYLEVLSKNVPAYDLWVRAYNGERVRDELSDAIAQDKNAQIALVAFHKANSFDWSEAAGNARVLNEIDAFLAAGGSLNSACYREILADVSKQHILFYRREDDSDSLTLTAEHGSVHSTKLYILDTPDGVVPLEVNQMYLDLERNQKRRCAASAFVSEKIYSLDTKENIDSFVRICLSTDKEDRKAFGEQVKSFINDTRQDSESAEFVQNFEADVESVVAHFPSHLRAFLSDKLSLLHPRYIPNGLVASLARRLDVEQLRVSSEVVHWLLDVAAEGLTEEGVELGLCQVIVSNRLQEEWAAALLLMEVERHFRKNVEGRDIVCSSLANVEYRILILLSQKMKKDRSPGQTLNITMSEVLDLIEKLVGCGDVFSRLRDAGLEDWTYVLEETSWRKSLELLTQWKEDQLLEAVHSLSTLARKMGNAKTKLVIEKIGEKNRSTLSPRAILDLLFHLKGDDCNLPNHELPNFVSQLSFENWEGSVKSKLALAQGERNIDVLTKLIRNNANNSNSFKSLLEKISAVFKTRGQLHLDESFDESELKSQMRELAEKLKSRRDHDLDETKLQIYVDMVNSFDPIFKEVKGYYLRHTQKVSALLLLTNKNKSLIQVSTGEGKTSIVLVVAIVKALCDEKVHIVTSSSVLALRDATSDENKKIYSFFGVNVGHNCSENSEERKTAYSLNEVVYGDLSNFQRDHLLDSFYQKNIMGNHTRKQNMIIDEVDSMLLDKGNNMLYLSHDIGDLDKLDCVYAFIWDWINAPGQEESRRLNVGLIKSHLLSELYCPITRDELKLLDRKLTLVQVEELWDRLRGVGITNEKGVLIHEDWVDSKAIHRACEPPFEKLFDRIQFMLKLRRDRPKKIQVPNFLKPFVALHAEEWIRNAIQALSMEEDQDYVVDVDRGAVSADVYPIVTILDKDTGTDQANSQWDDGLHQFLQIKHGCKLTAQSLKAVFISNVTYFKQYDKIYGMTGTLGTPQEKTMLQRVHGVDFVTMPTFRSKKFVELPPVICPSNRDWVNSVVKETSDMLDNKGRSALLICETIEEVRSLVEALREAGRTNVHVYTRDYENFALGGDNGALEPGHVVVATNLAGRGTDIKPTKTLLDAGGLHVVLTYLPRNGRVEQQAFGRAARKGQSGTGRLVVLVADDGGTSALRIADMRVRRDARSLTKMEEFYTSQILGEEASMMHFTSLYKNLEKKLKSGDYPKELQEILLQFYVNKWALWLDRNETNIKTFTKIEVNASLAAELCVGNQLPDSYKAEHTGRLLLVLDQPSIIIRIGKHLFNSYPDVAITLFDAVIEREPDIAEFAFYYKCAARVRQIHETQGDSERRKREEDIRKDLRLASRAFEKRKDSVMQIARTIAGIRRQSGTRITDSDAFQIQTQNLVMVYETFGKSVDAMSGAPMTGFDLGGGDEELGEIVEKDLLKTGILQGANVSLTGIPEKDLESISSNYGIPYARFMRYLTDNKNVTDVNEFEIKLKTNLVIHNKGSFWKILNENNLIREELQMVSIVKGSSQFESSNPGLKSISFEDDTEVDTFIYSDSLPPTSEPKLFFAKADVMATLGTDTYKKMLEEGNAVELKRAILAKDQLLSKDFLKVDSITVQDLKDANFPHQDATLVLNELVEQNILEQRGESYFLAKYDYNSLQLSAPLYEETMLNIIAVFFAYYLAFARIKDGVAENPEETTIQIPLISNPHRCLLMDLFERDVIRRSRVDPQATTIDRDVNNLYKKELADSEFETLLKENEHTKTVSTHDAKELFRILGEHSWLSNNTIVSHDKRKPLTSSRLAHLEHELGKLFDARYRLASTVSSLITTLESGRGLLTTLSTPAASLKLLSEEAETQNVNIEELTVFALNGGDHLIVLSEKKYTIWMIISAAAVILMGVLQIVAGVVLEICSAGVMTHFAGVLISEGVSDMIYGISSFMSGEFSWKNYGIQKAVSIGISIATAGVGAFFSRLRQASQFGAKLIATSVGKKAVGKALLMQVGSKRLIATVAKRAGLKAIQGVAKELVFIGIDRLADLFVKFLCAKMAAEMVKASDAAFENNNPLQQGLSFLLGALGKEGALTTVINAARTMLATSGKTGELKKHMLKASRDVLKAVGSHVKNKKIAKLIERIDFLWEVVDLTVKGVEAYNLSQAMMNHLGRTLTQRNYKTVVKLNGDEAIFKKEVKMELKNLLQAKINEMLTDNLAKPILNLVAKKAVNKVINMIGNQTNKQINKFRERRDRKRLARASGTREVKKAREFVVKLRGMLTKRKDPTLLARLVLEDDLSMDAVGIQGIASVVATITSTDVTIVVHGDSSLPPKRFEALVDKTGAWPKKEVHVSVREGRFESIDLNISTLTAAGKNGHLFGAISALLPGDLSAKQVQMRLATEIKTNKVVQRAVRRDWYAGATQGRLDLAGRRLSQAVLLPAVPPQPTRMPPIPPNMPAIPPQPTRMPPIPPNMPAIPPQPTRMPPIPPNMPAIPSQPTRMPPIPPNMPAIPPQPTRMPPIPPNMPAIPPQPTRMPPTPPNMPANPPQPRSMSPDPPKTSTSE